MGLHPDHYAIVVGIDTYPQLPELKSAVRSATDFAAWLGAQDGGGLNQRNIHVILSPEAQPDSPLRAMPMPVAVERSLRYLGALSGRRVGARLYFYFSGHAFSTADGHIGLLMANAAIERLENSLSLQTYRQYFQAYAPFDEIVYILDCVPERVDAIPASRSMPVPTSGGEKRQVSELLLTTFKEGGQVLEPRARFTGDGVGLLTRSVLEGLRQPALRVEQRLSADSLIEYVRTRMGALAAGAPQGQQLRFESLGVPLDFTPAPHEAPLTTLLVVVPHWSAQVRIIDNLFRSVAGVGPVREVPEHGYASETNLPPGLYEVEVSVAGQTGRKTVLVQPPHTIVLSSEQWHGLKVDTPVPIRGSANARQVHTASAIKWSRAGTWKEAPGGDSRLFLFFRARSPRKGETVRELRAALHLLSASGKVLADLARCSRRNGRAGWLAFNADMPAGYYILRQGHPGPQARYLPVVLCSGWETQVFVELGTAPAGQAIALSMAPWGKGFSPDDEAAAAADVVLDGMQYDRAVDELVTGEKLSTLLRGKLEDPWLGVLAAYVLMSALEKASTGQRTEQPDSQRHLLEHVMNMLGPISAHPDVHALRLLLNTPTDAASFPYPPLLRLGLKWVQQNSIGRLETIPAESLTQVALDSLLMDSPWTRWSELRRAPLGWEGTTLPPAEQTVIRSTSRHRPTAKQYESRDPDGGSPRMPIYRLVDDAPVIAADTLGSAALSDEADAGFPILSDAIPGLESLSIAAAAPSTELSEMATLDEVMLVEKALDLTRPGTTADLPSRVAIPVSTLNEILGTADPVSISATHGLPLSRTVSQLETLQKSSARAQVDSSPAVLTAEQQAIIGSAIKQSLHGGGAGSRLPQSDTALADSPGQATANDPGVSPPALTIEAVVAQLRSAADRISVKAPGHDADAAAASAALSERLRAVSDDLFARAEFILLSDTSGRSLYANGAFLALISPGGRMPRDEDHSMQSQAQQMERIRWFNQRSWEHALSRAPTGRSTLPAPAGYSSSVIFDLQRTAMVYEADERVAAYLNVFRPQDAPHAVQSTLRLVDPLLPQIALEASLYAYGSRQSQKEALNDLATLITELEGIVRPRDASGGAGEPETSSDGSAPDAGQLPANPA